MWGISGRGKPHERSRRGVRTQSVDGNVVPAAQAGARKGFPFLRWHVFASGPFSRWALFRVGKVTNDPKSTAAPRSADERSPLSTRFAAPGSGPWSEKARHPARSGKASARLELWALDRPARGPCATRQKRSMALAPAESGWTDYSVAEGGRGAGEHYDRPSDPNTGRFVTYRWCGRVVRVDEGLGWFDAGRGEVRSHSWVF